MHATLDHVVLNVHDVERALCFYTEVIGLSPERVNEYRDGAVLFPSLRVNDVTVIDLMPPALWGADTAGVETGDGIDLRTNVDHFCLTIDESDWSSLCGRLDAAGIAFEVEPTTLWGARGDGTAAYVRDSEGNRVELRYYPA